MNRYALVREEPEQETGAARAATPATVSAVPSERSPEKDEVQQAEEHHIMRPGDAHQRVQDQGNKAADTRGASSRLQHLTPAWRPGRRFGQAEWQRRRS